MTKTELFGLYAEEIAVAIAPYGLEKYRGRQIAEWIYRRRAGDFTVMTNLPTAKREVLTDNFSLGRVDLLAEQHSGDGPNY